jgi:hypothetical protein
VTEKPTDPLDRDWVELSSPDSWNVRCVYDVGARELAARELERIAERYAVRAREERRRSNLLRNGSPKWQYEASIASYQELHAFARELKRRAGELRTADAAVGGGEK